jgi:hypothetical protein
VRILARCGAPGCARPRPAIEGSGVAFIARSVAHSTSARLSKTCHSVLRLFALSQSSPRFTAHRKVSNDLRMRFIVTQIPPFGLIQRRLIMKGSDMNSRKPTSLHGKNNLHQGSDNESKRSNIKKPTKRADLMDLSFKLLREQIHIIKIQAAHRGMKNKYTLLEAMKLYFKTYPMRGLPKL